MKTFTTKMAMRCIVIPAGISITVGYDISEELLSKIMRAARNA